jgi:hypothetical protein
MRNARIHHVLLPFSFLVGAFSLSFGGAGCGGSSGSGEPGCFDYSSFDDMTPAVSFKTDVLPILRQSCGLSSSCHSEETPSVPSQHYYGSPLSAGDLTDTQIKAIFDQSVGVASIDNPDMKVVAAGDPEHSFLVYKIDGDPNSATGLTCSALTCAKDKSCGTSMPQGGPAMDEASKDKIRRWIAQGAKND